MAYIITLESKVTETIDIRIEDGDDWDGRPVTHEWDAADLAYDIAVDRYRGRDWQVVYTHEVSD